MFYYNKINLIYSRAKAITIQEITKDRYVYQSLVGSVVIDVELGREDHGSIPRNYNRKEAETT
jgi:hypothetical protein